MFKKENRIFLIFALTFLLLSIIGYVIFNIRSPRYREVNIAPRARVSVLQTDTGVGGKGRESIIDNKENTWWYGYTDSENPNWVALAWEEPVVIDRVVVNFGGERYALNYKLQVWDGVLWRDIAVVNDNRSDQVAHILPEERKASISEIRLHVTRTFQPDNLLRVSEFSVYEKQLKSFFAKDILSYLGYVVLLLLILFGLFKLLPKLPKLLSTRYGRVISLSFGAFIVILLFYILFHTLKQEDIYVNIAPQAKISVRQTLNYPRKQGGSRDSIIDEDRMTWWYGYVLSRNPNWVVLSWDELKEIGRIKIVFGGNRHAVDYKIQAWKEAFWEDRAAIRGNSSDLKIHSFPDKDKIQTTRIRLYITRTQDKDNIQRISEVYVYGKAPATFFTVFRAKVIQPVKHFFSQVTR